ncbi:MAG TPA: ferrochelatase, partial [Anseongella sp.]|nr:ferrochelatase [Anseongella sp.]
MKTKKGILLVNLGTPDSPATSDVRKYLREFLLDPRVLDIPAPSRFFLVNGIIAPFRAPRSGASYKEIWDKEKGSPLMYHSIRQQELLQEKLGGDYQVELAMRYQQPDIASALERFRKEKIFSIRVIPMYPQYASASGGSVNQKVMEIVSRWQIVPEIELVNSFHDHPLMIRTFAELGRKYHPQTYDHVLFSFHGLPVRQLMKADPSGRHCQQAPGCCSRININNRYCYSAQCYDTARLLAAELDLPAQNYTVCFQSRLGKTPWVEPYTSDVLKRLAAEGKKRLL